VAYTHTLILAVAGLTMITGVLGAVAQNEFRRILSFHIVSQIGYMIMGLGLFTPLALAGSIFYVIHHIIVKTNLFLVSGAVSRLRGAYELKNLGGLYRAYPGLAVLFMIPALSLAGIPPLSGFWAKLTLLQAGLEIRHYAIVTVALAAGMLTLFSMIKIWTEAFWKPSAADPQSEGNGGQLYRLLLPVALLAILTVAIGLFAQPFFALAERAAEQLMNPEAYIRAVLGDIS
jgi:multicomponent Na+:H+ antiporter subunit D